MTFLNVDKRGRSTLPEEVRRDLGIEGEEGALVILEKTPVAPTNSFPPPSCREPSCGFTTRS